MRSLCSVYLAYFKAKKFAFLAHIHAEKARDEPASLK